MSGPDQLRAEQALRAARRASAGTVSGGAAAVAETGDGSRQVALEVRDLWVRFPGRGRMIDIVRDVSFTAHEGEVVGIVGESGSGKTMTAMAISRLVPYPGTVSGDVKLLGEDLRVMPERDMNRFLANTLAVVFQDPMSSLNPALTIGRQLTEGAEKHRRLNHQTALRIAIDRLREVNIPIPDRQVERHPHELSGGMRQRVMIAMGLMNEPRLLICDEPTTALDVTIQAQIMDLLARVNAEHKVAIVLISHNLGLVRQNCDRVLVMYAGRIVEDLPSDQLLTAPLHPYTRALLHAVPDMTRVRGERFATIPGQAPDLASVPTGCAFHPRCPLKMDRCESELPPLVTRPDGHRVACWAVEAVPAVR